MTNMAAEIGGFTGIVAPDSKVVEFLVERRGMSATEAEKMIEGLYSDPDANMRRSSNWTRRKLLRWSRRRAIRATASTFAT